MVTARLRAFHAGIFTTMIVAADCPTRSGNGITLPNFLPPGVEMEIEYVLRYGRVQTSTYSAADGIRSLSNVLQ